MRVLHLTLKKVWFDLIASGEKKEEYREITPYWVVRLSDNSKAKEFDIVRFKNGYQKDSPVMDIECKNITFGYGKTEWGAMKGKRYFIIQLGEILNQN